MARDHGRVLSAIWRDADFLELHPDAQRLYMLLLSQSNLTHAGTITVTVGRWARLSKHTTAEDVRDVLTVLEGSRFVVLDWETEELLVRTFIRNDKVYKQPNVMAAAADDAAAISSPKLRHALRAELDRLPLDEVSAGAARDKVQTLVKGLSDALATPELPLPEPPATPSGTLPVTPESSPTRNRTTTQKPLTRVSPSPSPTPSPTVSDGAPSANGGKLIKEHIDACRKRPPERVVGQLAKHVGEMLAEGIDPDDIRAGLAKFREKGDLHPSTLSSLVNAAMNAPRRAPRRQDVDPEDEKWL